MKDKSTLGTVLRVLIWFFIFCGLFSSRQNSKDSFDPKYF